MKLKPFTLAILTLLIFILGSSITPILNPGLADNRLPGIVSSVESIKSENQDSQGNLAMATPSNSFGLELFREISQQNQGENIFISPSSLSFALSMLYNGAQGETATEMSQVLRTFNMDLQTVNQQNQQLVQAIMTADPKVELAIANSLWLKQDFNLKPEFLNNIQSFYQAKVTELDFNNPEAVEIINSWVADNTKDKITEIIDDIDPQQVLFLINAVYFKGEWKYQFDPEKTTEKPFELADGETKSHPFMTQETKFPYLETESFTGVSLPYGETGNLSMYLLLPKDNLNSLIESLNQDNWQQWLSQFQNQEVTVSVPKFKVEYEVDLAKILPTLGMKQVFSPQNADLSNMTSQQVYVDKVKHKTFVEIDEIGTEAAAVTSTGIRVTSIGRFVEFNKPFVYAIVERQTGTILFIGSMLEPKM